MSLHIVTGHYHDDRWIDIQLAYFKRHINVPYKVHAFLNVIPVHHEKKFFYSFVSDIEGHAQKLNRLANRITIHVDDDDLLMFIDGDAFPIGDVVSFAKEQLQAYPLVAVQRKENLGEPQPHPSFCITTVGFWKEIKGDWRAGYRWTDSTGNSVTDVGSNLLRILTERGLRWKPMLRSNRVEEHPLWFGIYEDLVYHHGSGFRKPVSRTDLANYKIVFPKNANCFRTLSHKLRHIPSWYRLKKLTSANTSLSNRVYQSILDNENFYQHFQ